MLVTSADPAAVSSTTAAAPCCRRLHPLDRERRRSPADRTSSSRFTDQADGDSRRAALARRRRMSRSNVRTNLPTTSISRWRAISSIVISQSADADRVVLVRRAEVRLHDFRDRQGSHAPRLFTPRAGPRARIHAKSRVPHADQARIAIDRCCDCRELRARVREPRTPWPPPSSPPRTRRAPTIAVRETTDPRPRPRDTADSFSRCASVARFSSSLAPHFAGVSPIRERRIDCRARGTRASAARRAAADRPPAATTRRPPPGRQRAARSPRSRSSRRHRARSPFGTCASGFFASSAALPASDS